MSYSQNLLQFEGVFAPVSYRDAGIDLLDQTLLPTSTSVLRLITVTEVAEAIRVMRVRGAPAIGITAAYGIALAAERAGDDLSEQALVDAADELHQTRPTAVNLAWALDRMLRVYASHQREDPGAVSKILIGEAKRIHAEDIAANRQMGLHGADLLPDRSTLLTICNTGALATGGIGTAYGVIHTAHKQNKLVRAYPCETRPRLQGARLTAWELQRDGIPFKLLSDGAAAALMATGKIDAVLAGADRIARNGDAANKIGTYGLAVLAKYHSIPMYIVAPMSTVDPATPDGEAIPIEERDADEVLAPRGTRFAPEGADAWNPAFDVTPAKLITAIITEKGVVRPPIDFSPNAEV